MDAHPKGVYMFVCSYHKRKKHIIDAFGLVGIIPWRRYYPEIVITMSLIVGVQDAKGRLLQNEWSSQINKI
jgi:hypothetical protein